MGVKQTQAPFALALLVLTAAAQDQDLGLGGSHNISSDPEMPLDFLPTEQASAEFSDEIVHDCEIPLQETFNRSPKIVWFKNCPLPNTSYADELASFNISTSSLQLLGLELRDQLPPDTSHFEGLRINSLTIRYRHNNSRSKYLRLESDFLESMCNLTEIVFERVELPLLPLSSRVQKITLIDGVSRGAWGGCSALRHLTLVKWNLAHIPPLWLAHCPKLTSLHLHNITTLQLKLERVVSGAIHLRELVIRHSALEKLDKEVAEAIALEKLDVSHNQINSILDSTSLPALKELDLSGNHFWSSAAVKRGLEGQPALEAVALDGNLFLNMCDGTRAESPKHNIMLPTIKRLSIPSTITDRLCFEDLVMDSLEYLDLTDSRIKELQLGGLPKSRAARLSVDLQRNPVQALPFHRGDAESLRHRQVELLGVNLTLSCDCENALLARVIRDKRLLTTGVYCDGAQLPSAPAERVECDRFACAEGACTCRRAWRDNATVARCAGGRLRAAPRVPGLRALHAAGNFIRTLHVEDLPDTLIYVDISRNHVSRLGAAPAAALLRAGRRVRLAGNPLVCDCDNQALITALRRHRAQIEDYDNVTCVDDGRPLDSIETNYLCSSEVGVTGALAATAALVGLTALAVAIYYRFGRELKIFIYARGWCLCCVREEELDAERPYDAFVSFSHKDEQFVMEEILPVLEGHPNNFKLCVHYRDWKPGELIPTQITRSVEQSRRTIILLSRNFMESVWGLLEFRTAHISALQEGRVRLIIIVLDDIVDNVCLDAELRGYLRTHTYVKWGDQWFWDKLRYALPHRRLPRPSVVKINFSEVDFNLTEMRQGADSVPSDAVTES